MSSSAFAIALSIAALGGIGAAAQRIVAPVSAALSSREPLPVFSERSEAAAPGPVLALLGGYRGLMADLLWLRLHLRWEARDRAGSEALLRRVSVVDPRPVFFWKNAARIIAYDFAAWRVREAGGDEAISAENEQSIVREQARAALAHLESALARHPDCAELWVERANIEYGRLSDFAAAAESYRHAAEQKDAPAYAARLHAEMLRRLGRKREALTWLTRLHSTLDPDDDPDGAKLVLARILALERELGVSTERSPQH